MRASPYDLRGSVFRDRDLSPVAVETDEGKRQYTALQSTVARAAEPVRQRLLEAYDKLLRVAEVLPPSPEAENLVAAQ